MNTTAHILCTWIAPLALATTALAQNDCDGTTQVEDYLLFRSRAESGLYDRDLLPPTPGLPISIALRFHDMQQIQNPTNLPLQTQHLSSWISRINAEFAGTDIQFHLVPGTYNTFSFGDRRFSDPSAPEHLWSILNFIDTPDAIDIFTVDSLSSNGAFLGAFGTYSICSRGQGIVLAKRSSPNGITYGGVQNNVGPLVHEIGHVLDLIHPSEEWEDPPGSGSVNYAADCPDFSNCAIAGDFVCDTPAEPVPGAYFDALGNPIAHWLLPSCRYREQGQLTVGDDCAGESYFPDILNGEDDLIASGNFMAMSPPECRDDVRGSFTALQRERMFAALINFRRNLYDPCVFGDPNLFGCGVIDPVHEAAAGAAVAVSHLSHESGIGVAIGLPGSGRIHLFRGSSATTLEREQTLVGTPSDGFGTTLSFDGDTLLVGLPQLRLNHGNGTPFLSRGAVMVQRRQVGCTPSANCPYLFVPPIEPPDEADIVHFGASLDSYGDWAVVGANLRTQSATGPHLNKVFVYKRNRIGAPSTWDWTLHSVLVPPTGGPTYPTFFGCEVAISGQYIAVGAWGALNASNGNVPTGQAFVYTYDASSNTWSAGVALPVDATPRRFGWDLDIWGDTIVVGAPGVWPATPGRAYFYAKQGNAWVNTSTINDPQSGGAFGSSVSIAQNTAIVADPGYSAPDVGTIYELARQPFRNWAIVRTEESPAAQAGQRFGSAVAATPDVYIIGSEGLDRPVDSGGPNVTDAGGVYAYTSTAPSPPMSMTSNVAEVDVSDGGTALLSIDCGPAAAGKFFVISGTSTASETGRNYSPLTQPPLDSQEHFAFHSVLTPDLYTTFVQNPNNGIVGPISGSLDAQGRATVTFTWPAHYLQAAIPSPVTILHTVVLGLDLHYESTPAIFVLKP